MNDIQQQEANSGVSSNTIPREPEPGNGSSRLSVDELVFTRSSVGWGQLGLNGNLGYEEKQVVVLGQSWPHALSAHAPSSIALKVDGAFDEFQCHVAINDDVLLQSASADFFVVADQSVVGVARNVRPGQMPRLIWADVRGMGNLELVCEPRCPSHCHSVWLDPVLIHSNATKTSEGFRFVDGLERAEIVSVSAAANADLCIATVGSKGFEQWVDDLLSSICAFAQCPDAMLAVFSIGDSDEIRSVADKYGAMIVPCFPKSAVHQSIKSVLYAAGRVICAKKFICIDADTLVHQSLQPIVAAIDAAPPGAILACREGNWAANLLGAVEQLYMGKPSDIDELLWGSGTDESRYSFVVNDGFFAGSRSSLIALDNQIRYFNQAPKWVDSHEFRIPWRNQFIFNLALAQSLTGIELDSRFNVQLDSRDTVVQLTTKPTKLLCNGRPVSVVHFNGGGRRKYQDWRAVHRAVANPLVRSGGAAGLYESFVEALRQWVGMIGIDALAWTFYGSTDGRAARVPDSSTFPLFAVLHYLIRSNGVRRVIETGTARGVSAACLASAVAHREGGTVVTIDVNPLPEREALWRLLPERMQRCIDQRTGDSRRRLQEAINVGETYDAALLDAIHTREFVLQEFELVRQLVCNGGLILIHDAVLTTGTVDDALEEIERMGFGVVRLWTADSAFPEDDHLGLALIENKRN